MTTQLDPGTKQEETQEGAAAETTEQSEATEMGGEGGADCEG